MALTYNDTDHPIAFDHSCGDLLSFGDPGSDKHPTLDAYGKFEVVPNFKAGFETIMIVGAMGSGKTYWASQYMHAYRKLFPERKIFIFSQKTSDPSIADNGKLKVRRVPINDDFIDADFSLPDMKQFHDSLVLFDDFMTFSQKKYIEKIVNIILQFVTLARQYHCYTLITSHMFYGFNNKQLYASIQTELNKLVFFKGVNVYQLKYIMKNYFGYWDRFTRKLLTFDPQSRYVCISKYPAYVVSANRCSVIRERMR